MSIVCAPAGVFIYCLTFQVPVPISRKETDLFLTSSVLTIPLIGVADVADWEVLQLNMDP